MNPGQVVSQLLVTGDRDDVATALGVFQNCLKDLTRSQLTVCWPEDGGKVMKWLYSNRRHSAVSKSAFASLEQTLKQAKVLGIRIGRKPGNVTGRLPFVTVYAAQQAAQSFKDTVEQVLSKISTQVRQIRVDLGPAEMQLATEGHPSILNTVVDQHGVTYTKTAGAVGAAAASVVGTAAAGTNPMQIYSLCTKTGCTITLIQGDITHPLAAADVVVNPANCKLEHKGGLAHTLATLCPSMQSDCAQLLIARNGSLTTGEAVATGASGPLLQRGFQYIVHAVGPMYQQHKYPLPQQSALALAVAAAVLEAAKCGCTSLSLPPISTGIYHFPIKEASEAIARGLLHYASSKLR